MARSLARRCASLILMAAAFHASGLVWCVSPSGHTALEFFLTGCCNHSGRHVARDCGQPPQAGDGGQAQLNECGAMGEDCTDFAMVLIGSSAPSANHAAAQAPALFTPPAQQPELSLVQRPGPSPNPGLLTIRSTILLT